jgi:hypothetical protein
MSPLSKLLASCVEDVGVCGWLKMWGDSGLDRFGREGSARGATLPFSGVY